MTYIPLQPISIVNYEAKDLDIINLNSTFSKIEVYLNQMNNNVQELGNFKEQVGTELPEGEDGDTFILLRT